MLSDPDGDGFRRVEDWLTALWDPILADHFAVPAGGGAGAAAAASSEHEYNPNAKQELQKLLVGKTTRLEYLEDRPMLQSKHAQKYFVSVYLSGCGYEREKLGYGEGRNKVEAGNRAAMAAFEGRADVVDKVAAEVSALRQERLGKARVEVEAGVQEAGLEQT